MIPVAEIIATACKTSGITVERVHHIDSSPSAVADATDLADSNAAPEYVLYWTRECFRVEQNEALALARQIANHFQLPLVVLATIDLHTLASRAYRYVQFVFEGLIDAHDTLNALNIQLHVRLDPNSPTFCDRSLSLLGDDDSIQGFGNDARICITDLPFRPHGYRDLTSIASHMPCPLIAVNIDTMFPLSEFDFDAKSCDIGVYIESIDAVVRRVRAEAKTSKRVSWYRRNIQSAFTIANCVIPLLI